MRTIVKLGDGGYQLNRSNENPPTTSGEATSRWSSFGYKDEVSGYLASAQYSLCAYSEIRHDLYQLEAHIEHVEPKSRNPLRTFDYTNLALNALSDGDLKIMDRDDVFGGHAKLSVYDASKFISPFDNDCDRYFAYLSTGKVEPVRKLTDVEKIKAQYTIDLLNLNSPYLVTARKKWLTEIDELFDKHIEDDMCLHQLASIDLVPAAERLSEFFTATRQRFGRIAEEVLAREAPELV